MFFSRRKNFVSHRRRVRVLNENFWQHVSRKPSEYHLNFVNFLLVYLHFTSDRLNIWILDFILKFFFSEIKSIIDIRVAIFENKNTMPGAGSALWLVSDERRNFLCHLGYLLQYWNLYCISFSTDSIDTETNFSFFLYWNIFTILFQCTIC